MMKLILIVTQRRRLMMKLGFNCEMCLVEDESVRLGGGNSIPMDVTNHDHTCQPFSLGSDFCDIDPVQDSIPEDMVSCPLC